MKAGAKPVGKRFAELGLAGAGNSMQQDVHSLFLPFKGAA